MSYNDCNTWIVHTKGGGRIGVITMKGEERVRELCKEKCWNVLAIEPDICDRIIGCSTVFDLKEKEINEIQNAENYLQQFRDDNESLF